MHEPRRSQIVDYVNREGQVSFSALKSVFPDVSDMTLRTDLKNLDREGRIIRTHGGAKSIETVIRPDDVYYKKVNRNVEKKQQIAKKALQLVYPGASMFIDCGSTLMQFAKLLPDEAFFIVTNNISSVYDLARLTRPEIHVLGGKLNRLNLSAGSPENSRILSRYNFDLAFIATSAYSIQQGFTCPIGAHDDSRSIILQRSRKNIILLDSSKVGRVFPMTYVSTDLIHAIVSDDELPQEVADDFRSRGIEVY